MRLFPRISTQDDSSLQYFLEKPWRKFSLFLLACLVIPLLHCLPVARGYDVSARLAAPTNSQVIDFHPIGGIPLDSMGIEIEIEAAKESSGLAAVGRGYLFRARREIAIQLGVVPAGVSKIQILWKHMPPSGQPSLDAFTAYNFSELGLVDSEGDSKVYIKNWSFLKSATRHPAPWESIRQRDFSESANGWRQGIPADGFGRFGWLQTSGLLVGDIRTDGFGAEVLGVDGGPKQRASWKISRANANNLAWSRTSADWTHVAHETRYDLSLEIENELMAKAQELIKEQRLPQRLTGSLLAPGVLLHSHDRTLVLEPVDDSNGSNAAPQSIRLLMQTRDGLTWTENEEAVPGERLVEGWLVAVWPGREAMPLLVVPQHRPVSIRTSGKKLTLEFAAPLEHTAFAFPAGYRGFYTGQQTHNGISTDKQLAGNARRLAKVLRAYPISAHQEFRTSPNNKDYIEIRETVRHLVWENDWKEPSHRVAPLPPLLAFATKTGYPAKLPESYLVDFNWPTKTGPYLAVEGSEVRYEIPVPPTGARLYPRPPENDELSEGVARAIETASQMKNDDRWLEKDPLTVWWMRAPVSLALPLLNMQQREQFLAHWRNILDIKLHSHSWAMRTEPFSGARYPVSFGWVEKHTSTLGDLNSGVGALLYGVWAYARSSSDWDIVEDRWPVLRGAIEYFLLENDWANYTTGAREHSGSSAIDMDGIAYEGVVAYAEMAAALGKKDDEVLGRLLAARLAISIATRWLGKHWTHPDMPREDWEEIGVGFSEFSGFDFLHSRDGGPDHVSSELALCLTWAGQFPELYSLHRWALGDAFWKWFEYDYVEKKLLDWRADHPGNRNNHAANITAHLYFRALLGESSENLRNELASQGRWAQEPSGPAALENAPFFALLAGLDAPVSLTSWGRAGLVSATYDKDKKSAVFVFTSKHPAEVMLDIKEHPKNIMINNSPLGASGVDFPHKLTLSIPSGESRIELKF
jgi:hypothetical protein